MINLFETTTVCLGLLITSLSCCVFRIWKGPSLLSRILSLDALMLNMIALLCLISLRQKTEVYIDFILVSAILGFITTLLMVFYIYNQNKREQPDD